MQKNVQITVFVLISHASKAMLKIFQARLHVNWQLPDVKVGFQRGRGTRDQISNILDSNIIKQEDSRKNLFCLIDYTKAFDCVDHNKLWKILKETEYQTTLLASW